MREYRIAAIPGDGIGVEVIAAGLRVLEVLAGRDRGFRLKVQHFPWSSDYYLKHGHYIPDGGPDQLRPRCSRAPGWRASTASPSSWRAAARAGISPWSRNPTPSATAW